MKSSIEYISCNLCGSSEYTIDEKMTIKILAREPSKVVVCKKCGLGYLNPRFVEKLTNIYNENYYKEYLKSSQMTGGSDILEEYLKKRLHRIESMVKKGKLLEIGSAFGLFLNYAKSRGWEIEGVEVSPWASEFSKKQYGLKILNASFEEVSLPDESFDVVHMNHVLEHMYDPMNTLLKAHRILKRGGLLVFEVPNEFGSMADLLEDLIWQFRSGENIVPYTVPSPHLYFFKPKTIRRFLQQTGFRVVILKTTQRGIEYRSRIPGGKFFYWLWYFIEQRLKLGPFYEVFAIKK